MHPQLVKPAIFVTSPSDVEPERDTAIVTALRLANLHPNKPAIFDWRKELFSSGRSYQEQIPSLQHPNCWVTICIFGERLGEPVDRCLDELQAKGRLPDGLSDDRLTLDQTDVVKVPLTGSVYEFLEASRGEVNGFGKVFVYFKGPASLRRPSADVYQRRFGNFAHKLRLTRQRDPDTQQWELVPEVERAAYEQQIKALARFHDAFLANKDCRTFKSLDDLAALIEADLRAALNIGEPNERQLFKALGSFGASDHRALFGRSDEVAEIVERLEQGERAAKAATLLVLKGTSGSGKSSLAKAGVAGRLAAQGATKARRYAGVDATTHRLDRTRGIFTPLSLLGLRLALAARPYRGPDKLRQHRPPAAQQHQLHQLHQVLVAEILTHAATWTADGLERRLLAHFDAEQAFTGQAIVPVVVLDQFETKLGYDYPAQEFRERWLPVLDLLDRLARARRGWVLVPLPFEAMHGGKGKDFASKLNDWLASLGRPACPTLDHYTVDFPPRAELIKAIISRPFECVGEPLDDNIVAGLMQEIDELRQAGGGTLLPLIGLVLDAINTRRKDRRASSPGQQQAVDDVILAGKRPSRDETAQLDQQMHADRKARPLTIADLGGDMTLASQMSQQGEKALTAFEDRFGEVTATERPIVRENTRRVLDQLLYRLAQPRVNDDAEPDAEPVIFELKSAGIDYFKSRVPAEQQDLARALREARLLTRVSTNSVRLVHEFVLRAWEPAAIWRRERSRIELLRAPLQAYLRDHMLSASAGSLDPDQLNEIDDLLPTMPADATDRPLLITALTAHFDRLATPYERFERFEAAVAARAEDLCLAYLAKVRDVAGVLRMNLDS